MYDEQLKLAKQICFPLYAISRFVTQQYRPLLDELNITYPQYLVLLVLWEKNDVAVKEISEKLLLETNTLTPLLKRMQANGHIYRRRCEKDERKVIISLTPEGEKLKEKAADVPASLIGKLNYLDIEKEDVEQLKLTLDKVLLSIRDQNFIK